MIIMKYIRYILLIALGVMSSCNFLDVEPNVNGKVRTGEMSEPQDVLNGAYREMGRTSYYGRNTYVFGDVGTDNIVVRSSGGRFNDNYFNTKNSRTSESVDDTYDISNQMGQIYRVLNHANTLIHTAGITDDIKGQSLALRAFLNFDLVRFYGDVPLVTEPSSDLNEVVASKPTNNTAAEIYAQIEKDLTEAKGLITNTSSFKFTLNAVYGLETRVFLTRALEDTNVDKNTYLQKVIDSYNMITGVSVMEAGDYIKYFNNKESAETLFEVIIAGAQSRGSDDLGALYIRSGYGAYTCSPDFYSLFSNDDVRQGVFYLENGLFYINKFAESEGVVGLHSPKVLRYSEAVLNAAEAQALLGNTADAITLTDMIRSKRYTTGTAPVSTGLIDDVLAERRLELCFEGHRMFDLRRNNMDMNLINSDGTARAPKANIPARDQQFYFPIPQNELNVNSNLKQINGYE
ncbi:RagB/SusD family nutrient uptake outer membrane protein [Flammeovirga pectinis]|uniref:RagB/SusD family nutrient uptake outer membrane protein n=2 Tax=Flammeovirga pectinis TaxID=2494373 RepID=A0A3S9P8G9_9BACT|nr:RagB/SusD family nutrient uptake outer membrane protein [Flammeovirga pectinis]